jgi:hypothetical protein
MACSCGCSQATSFRPSQATRWQIARLIPLPMGHTIISTDDVEPGARRDYKNTIVKQISKSAFATEILRIRLDAKARYGNDFDKP